MMGASMGRKWCKRCQRGNYVDDKGNCQDCGTKLFDIGLDDGVKKKGEKEINYDITLGGGYTDKGKLGNYDTYIEPKSQSPILEETEEPKQEPKVVKNRKVAKRKPRKKKIHQEDGGSGIT